MLFMVIETFTHGPEPVYARAAERGRMLPPGLAYVDSWVDERGLDRCFQLMETGDPRLSRSGRRAGATWSRSRSSRSSPPARPRRGSPAEPGPYRASTASPAALGATFWLSRKRFSGS